MTRTPVLLVALAAAAVTAAGQPQSARTAWFQKAGWGVFIHYLAETPDVPVEEWNRRIDNFDVEGLARQLESAHAGYLILTLGQNSGHYLSPNAAYDRLTGISPSKCSRRDLVSDMQKALSQRGIRMMVYLPAGAPDRDKVAMEKLQWTKGPARNREFQLKWEQVIGEWSQRWGTRVSGWWFDGCYWPNTMYRQPDAPNFASFAAATRKGNPDSIVAFNRGVILPIISISEQEDYTAGETDDPDRVRYGGFWQDGAAFHMLSFLGQNWSQGEPRFAVERVVNWTRTIVSKRGVVSWDVPTDQRGLIRPAFQSQLEAIGKAIQR
jgi:alpha-L-fucosidase